MYLLKLLVLELRFDDDPRERSTQHLNGGVAGVSLPDFIESDGLEEYDVI